MPATRLLARGLAGVAGDAVLLLVGRHNGLSSVAWAGLSRTVPTWLATSARSPTSLGALSVRQSARHQHEQLVFAGRELLEQRRRLERIDLRGGGGATRRGRAPRLVEVAVVGLPARAAPLDLDGGRLR
jgi:hypothetical protein